MNLVFPGRNTFFCNGRCIMAGDPGVFYLTIGLIIVCAALFFSFECRLTYGDVNVMPYGFLVSDKNSNLLIYSIKIYNQVIIGGGILFLLTLLNLLRTACSDPGIIPRATHSEAANTEAQIKAHEQSTGQLNKPRIKIGKSYYSRFYASWFYEHPIEVWFICYILSEHKRNGSQAEILLHLSYISTSTCVTLLTVQQLRRQIRSSLPRV